jgi:hypothetical protein
MKPHPLWMGLFLRASWIISAMPKSEFAFAVDYIQRSLKPLMTANGFRVKGRTFNRITSEELIHVVGIQMGPSDPPGTVHIPALRPNLHGLFAVNLGIYVPEVHQFNMSGKPIAWVQDYDCCIRARLGALIGKGKEVWWRARSDEDVTRDVREALEKSGFPFFEQFGTRDRILANFSERKAELGPSSPPRIVAAIILAQRGASEEARKLLYEQSLETLNPGHPAYVRKLAEKLQLG